MLHTNNTDSTDLYVGSSHGGNYTYTVNTVYTSDGTYLHGTYLPQPTYPSYPYDPTIYPSLPQQQQIILQPTIFPIAELEDDHLDERISAIEEKVEKLLELLLNEQDEEVCGHPEGELQSSDLSIGVRGRGRAALEAPQPKGATSWPSH